jgi:hypothetical protein
MMQNESLAILRFLAAQERPKSMIAISLGSGVQRNIACDEIVKLVRLGYVGLSEPAAYHATPIGIRKVRSLY